MWQPRNGVRSAIAVMHSNGGYVIAGRSLREVEQQESRIELLDFLAWLLSIGATLAASVGLVWMQSWCATGRTHANA
ncbi:MAG: hypothetical protein LC737_02800 [Chloroflexi bacterium]|nr:hypothetical protein [Chloroflexota bacterium]